MQLTKIIRLMWQREKQAKGAKIVPLKQRPQRRMSARMVFKRFKLKEGMNKEEIITKWKRLPRESRKLYEMENKPLPAKEHVKVVRRSTNTLSNTLPSVLMKK